jgi:hypothetical protein
MKICAIYSLEVVSGNPQKIGWKYIGQSKDCLKRQKEHFRNLEKKKHENPRLQHFYNKYGKESLSFRIVEACEDKELNEKEIFNIKKFKTQINGFNILIGGVNPPVNTHGGELQNIITKEIIKFNSCLEFSKKINSSSEMVSAVLNKKCKYVHEWCLPENINNFKIYQVVSPNREVFTIFDVSDFCRKNNIKNRRDFHNMLYGVLCSTQGWRLLNTREDARHNPNIHKNFALKHVGGLMFKGNNQSQFCKRFNLAKQSINRVIRGQKSTYKGWSLCQV